MITYCGGDIAASSLTLVLTALGHERVAVDDASLSEWAADPTLPMERDEPGARLGAEAPPRLARGRPTRP